MTSRLPRRAGIPNAFIRRFDARPDSSDLGNSFPGDSTSWLGGLLDRPVILQTTRISSNVQPQDPGGGAPTLAAPRRMKDIDVTDAPDLPGGTSVGPLADFGDVG